MPWCFNWHRHRQTTTFCQYYIFGAFANIKWHDGDTNGELFTPNPSHKTSRVRTNSRVVFITADICGMHVSDTHITPLLAKTAHAVTATKQLTHQMEEFTFELVNAWREMNLTKPIPHERSQLMWRKSRLHPDPGMNLRARYPDIWKNCCGGTALLVMEFPNPLRKL